MAEGDQLIGLTIAGKYRIRRLIGVGGMGSVYEGEHVELGKRVAIKLIDAGGNPSAELATRFKREARAASAVESEGIVQVFDVGRDPDIGLYMVMELLHGEDLEARLRKQPGRRVEPVLAAQIGYQVARALVKAHGARVIHRDLKPANIFLTDREDGALRVKILDFGVSKLLASEASIAASKGLLELTQAGVALGTPQYMSPEQAQGLTTVDLRTDVWGLGVVLYEALAGIPAFPELANYQETIINLLQSPPQPLAKVAPWVPAALADVVHAAIVHDVGRRIQDCGAFATRLEEAVPEAVTATTGPFTAVQLARLASSPSYAAYKPPVPVAEAPAEVPAPDARPARPVTLGDDTQVVLRPSDPSATYEDHDPSTTMLADSVRSANLKGRPAKVEVFDGSKPLDLDDSPLSTGDPTMFQSPAWVEQPPEGPKEGPTTLKTGMSLAKRPGGRATQGIAAVATAFAVVTVGGALLLFALREKPSDVVEGAPASTTSAVPAPSASPLSQPLAEPSATRPAAPPATGTAPVPLAPATGTVIEREAPSTMDDASADSRP